MVLKKIETQYDLLVKLISDLEKVVNDKIVLFLLPVKLWFDRSIALWSLSLTTHTSDYWVSICGPMSSLSNDTRKNGAIGFFGLLLW